MNTHTHLLADRIAANHHNDMIRAAARRSLAANCAPASARRRIALPTFARRRDFQPRTLANVVLSDG